MGSLSRVWALRGSLVASLMAMALAVTPALAADVSTPFTGQTVNGGTVVHEKQGGKHVLKVSSDFQVPGSPDPHWQVIDSQGNVYLLNRLKLKDDKINTSITLPKYIKDVAKVQMWCAWAEVVLGEASFEKPLAMK